MSPGILFAVSLLAQAYPPWRLDRAALSPDRCPAPAELEVALAAELRREPSPPPQAAWSVTVERRPETASAYGDGAHHLDVSLRDPTHALRLSRVVPASSASCADVVDAVAFIVERYLRDLDWSGPAAEPLAPERLPASEPETREVLVPALPHGGLRIGVGPRVSVALLPVAEVGGWYRGERSLVTFDLSVPLRPGRLGVPPTPTVSGGDVTVWPWAARLSLGRAWVAGPWLVSAGPNLVVGVDFGKGSGLSFPADAHRVVWAAGLQGGLLRAIGPGVALGATAFADMTIWTQSFTVEGEDGSSRLVAEPHWFQVGLLIQLSLSFFS